MSSVTQEVVKVQDEQVRVGPDPNNLSDNNVKVLF
jgi:hypothetical protein